MSAQGNAQVKSSMALFTALTVTMGCVWEAAKENLSASHLASEKTVRLPADVFITDSLCQCFHVIKSSNGLDWKGP